MKQSIAHVALVVNDYDEAIAFYTQKLNFTLIEDTPLSPEKRWVILSPPGANECSLLLAKASGDEQQASVGNQTGGRVFLFLFTDDFWRDYNRMVDEGIKFVRTAEETEYGKVAVFEDLYGNKWDFIEPTDKNKWYSHIQG